MQTPKKAPAPKKTTKTAKKTAPAPKTKSSAEKSSTPPRTTGGRTASEANLKPFPPGVSGNPAGRPRKIYNVLKASGYSKDDIVHAFKEMSFYTEGELERLYKAKTTPAIVRITAKALFEAMKSGEFHKIQTILDHVLGKAVQKLQHTGGDPDDQPIQINNSAVDWSKLPTGVLDQLLAATSRPSDTAHE